MNAPARSVTPDHPEGRVLRTPRVYQRGFIAGTLGSATIAIWFLILDAIHGQPFQTPAVLGTAIFQGVGEVAAATPLTFDTVVGFTFVHWMAFVAIGCIVSQALVLVERDPNLDVGVLVLFVLGFVVFEFGFLVIVTAFAMPVLEAFAWPTAHILIGNLLAALAMGVYFWPQCAHPAA